MASEYTHEMIVEEAGCGHPAIYEMPGGPVEGWCQGCRAYYTKHDLWDLAVDAETLEEVEAQMHDPEHLRQLADYLDRTRQGE